MAKQKAAPVSEVITQDADSIGKDNALLKKGAKSVCAYVTHGVLSGGAVARVTASPLEELVTTDSIPATEAVRVAHNIRQISIAPLLGEAMSRISYERSVSSLFD